MIFWELIKAFLMTGLFAVGGGLATLPFLRNMSATTNWFTLEELFNMIAISESTPGPIGLNMSTYVGIQVAGISGGLVATLALVFPSFIILLILTPFLTRYKNSRILQGAFYGLRAASLGLIAAALFDILMITLFDVSALREGDFLGFLRPLNLLLFGLFLALLFLKKRVHPVLVIFMGLIVGVVLKL